MQGMLLSVCAGRNWPPGNVKFIRRHFDIIQVSRFNDHSSYSFHPKHLNNHIVINGDLNITDKAQLTALTRFAEDTVRKFIKAGGFMIDSCMAKTGCTINFLNYNGQASHHYSSVFQKGLDEYLKKYRWQDLWSFTIKAGERIEDNWIALPDGKFVLTAYVDDYAVGVSTGYIKKDNAKRRKFVFMLFTHDGELISEGDKP
jgi:hypothetical protein